MPIEGEAGVGYVLAAGLHLPPLMLTADEVDALALGARVVEQWADPDLVAAARSLREKVEAVLPPALQQRTRRSPLFAASFARKAIACRLTALRGAIRDRRKVRFRYRRADGTGSERTVQPLGLVLMMSAWLLVGWCEARADFRTFRIDRIDELGPLDEAFADLPGRGLAAFLRGLPCRQGAAAPW